MTDPPSQPPAPRRRDRRCIIDDPARVIMAKWPECKACKSIRLKVTRTLGRDGREVQRRVRCLDCGERWVLIIF